jgi:RNA polymerase sigma-70 factor (ECF subfamily)
MSAELDEARLVRRLRRRDEHAFTWLVRTYQDRVFALVFRMLGDRAEAEDVAQEVFVTVFKRIDQFRGDSQLSTWIYRIATNHTRNRIKYLGRRQHRRKQDIDETREADIQRPMTDPHPRPDREAEGRQFERILQRALGDIDEAWREVIVLRDVELLSYAEIAEILDVAEGTVKSRLFRARTALQQRIDALTRD